MNEFSSSFHPLFIIEIFPPTDPRSEPQIYFVPTPGAEMERADMFSKLRASAARLV
jgi:hypothetical protein